MHLVPVLIVAVGLYVLGMIVLALVAILGRVRGNRELKKRRLTELADLSGLLALLREQIGKLSLGHALYYFAAGFLLPSLGGSPCLGCGGLLSLA